MINRDRLVKTFCELARIDSPSGEEEEMAKEIIKRLENLGFKTKRDSYGNVIASDGRSDPILLSAHLDTVEPGRGIKPSIDGDRIVSDGTTILGGDCKAGVSAILEALESVSEDGEEYRPVELAFTREEEIGLVGARNLDFTLINAKEAIVFDGEGPVSQITASSPTYIGFDIEITGRAAHAGVEPEKGLSAIQIAADIISRLPQGRLDENTTFNVGNIEGGTVRNAVPENTTIKGEFRSTSLESLDGLRVQIADVLKEVRDLYPDALVDDHLHTEFETYTLTNDDPATLRTKNALASIGLDPTMKPSGGGTDGNVFRLNGISSVVVGMADHGMHTVREFVTIPDLVDAAHLCEALLRDVAD
ncbi:MAG: M20/M25/M40 family metallo-hydrolase [SAR202 cluster bacterium]|nr:M20/M25/M40 family metallo-hydrolase [SAR202 cluster bacterium]|tara:strand:+ start:998 stop:2083 length:1086 start_codon:yes stop_codon:yes gene_type:complete